MAFALQTVICSTRPGRVGDKVANWFHGVASTHQGFEAKLVDIGTFGLPVYDEPKHPRLQQYAHEHTRRWAESVAAADAFVFVMPEYNFGPPPSFVNALNYVYVEWNFKPCAFVSYGGISGALRAVQMAKQLVTTLKMAPIVDAVVAPLVNEQFDKETGAFHPNKVQSEAAPAMLTELFRWTEAMKPLRQDR